MIPSELRNLTALQKLYLSGEDHKLTGCIPSGLQGIEYDGDLPFCTGPTSKKVTSPPAVSLPG